MQLPERWTHKEIGLYLMRNPDYVRDHISKRPDFPKPINPRRDLKTKMYDPLAVRRWAGERV